MSTAPTDERISIPAELRERPQWMTWNYVDGQKVPNGKSNDPETWSFYSVVEIFDNIAFVISTDDPYTGIDLDGCIVDGEWTEWSKPIMEKFRGIAYAEISPSGTGVKLTTKGKKPASSRCTHKIGENKQQIECYDNRRFWTVTANVVEGFETIGEGQAAVDWLCETYFTGPVRQTGERREQSYNGGSSLSVLRRAQAYADNMSPASKGDLRNAAFRNSGHLHQIVGTGGERLTDSDVYHLLRGWNARNSEQLRDDELLEAAANGRKNGTPPAEKRPTATTFNDMRHSFNAANGVTTTEAGPTDEATPSHRSIISIGDLIVDYPSKRPPIIHGICRRGEVVNVIGAAKAGKSWLIAGLLQAVATGRDWMGHDVEQGRVLLVDNELHPEELADRLHRLAHVSKIAVDDLEKHIDVLPLRGTLTDIGRLRQRLSSVEPGTYAIVALDAFYRFLPEGTSENDNAQMMALYNALDAIAGELNCAIVLNHHASKGDQSNKAVTDVGSGAGSISRAADTHLIIRPHEMEDCAVLEGVCRSWPPLEPRTIRWEYPLWYPLDGIAAAVKRPEGKGEAAQERRDREAKDAVREQLGTKRRTRRQLQTLTGMGPTRVDRALASLQKAGEVERRGLKSKTSSKRTEVFVLVEPALES